MANCTLSVCTKRASIGIVGVGETYDTDAYRNFQTIASTSDEDRECLRNGIKISKIRQTSGQLQSLPRWW